MDNLTFYFIIFISIICIFTVLAEFECYTKYNFHQYWNPDLYNGNTFYFDDTVDEKYHMMSYRGRKIAKHKKIVICGLARNVMKNIEIKLQKLSFLGRHFKDYRIVCFENDSSDGSRDFLKKYSKKNNKFILLNCCNMGSCCCKLKKQEGYSLGQFSKGRMENMAIFREEYVKYIKKYLSGYDYVLVTDFDLQGNHSFDGFFMSLINNYDATYANGRTSMRGLFGSTTIAYDCLAYLDIDSDFSPGNLILDAMRNYYLMNKKINDHVIIPVKSAFNGYALYKMHAFLDGSYLGDPICEHVNFSKKLHKNGHKQCINSLWESYSDIQGPGGIVQIIKQIHKG